ncbi:aldehyde dehydrogenase (NADP(+)) [Tamlana sp. 2201CG12-4]|uniref:aldehyde dehydrogenase (NADP(+)) n=1 Tax=Tamlana sp. 2201CG12-4 TaxID=3112582 RepID=UPI002DBE50E0|nr:aldehyde dehydrogenase (NADP(+)) [Tamlana sp. 2201CG12-4]MEC3908494.1 aldehyde dehydrogenase (NADP(+)) [Tamlana sp. 2201CG12-4]
MEITGQHFIGNKVSGDGIETFSAVNPVNNKTLPGVFFNATTQEIDTATTKSVAAYQILKTKNKEDIAAFLEQIAEEIMALGDTLITRCNEETALPEARLIGERGRTVGQLRLFAALVREGSWVDATIDTAEPNRAPVPKSDLRQMLRPIGPIAVFGASNFPLAFSVAGGDTASALAASCPVIVKGHPAHPGTTELVARAILKAVKTCNMPEGTFSLVQGNTTKVGETLVKHLAIKAVAFTGSFKGGKALFDLANSRKEPIPVFAEMGSTNPVFILPKALKERGDSIAAGLVSSINLGVGQFCTNPGMVIIPKDKGIASFCDQVADKISQSPSATMLTPGIANAYKSTVDILRNSVGAEILSSGKNDDAPNNVASTVFKVSGTELLNNNQLEQEVFGPCSVLVEAETKEQVLEIARNLEGHLTATVHGTPEDFETFAELFQILEQKAGRLIINGFPTGVEVCHAMTHGGPYPSTTAPQTTSVGTKAIKRFVRPVCYQGFPDSLLPESLKDSNTHNIWRLVNGTFTKEHINR